jgi:hypothetical protein
VCGGRLWREASLIVSAGGVGEAVGWDFRWGWAVGASGGGAGGGGGGDAAADASEGRGIVSEGIRRGHGEAHGRPQ